MRERNGCTKILQFDIQLPLQMLTSQGIVRNRDFMTINNSSSNIPAFKDDTFAQWQHRAVFDQYNDCLMCNEKPFELV